MNDKSISNEIAEKMTSIIWVSVADSLAAGNCEAVTLREAAILWRRVLRGVGEPGAIRADALLAYRDDAYTRRAVLAAQRA
jgi:hypothetical protein